MELEKAKEIVKVLANGCEEVSDRTFRSNYNVTTKEVFLRLQESPFIKASSPVCAMFRKDAAQSRPRTIHRSDDETVTLDLNLDFFAETCFLDKGLWDSNATRVADFDDSCLHVRNTSFVVTL